MPGQDLACVRRRVVRPADQPPAREGGRVGALHQVVGLVPVAREQDRGAQHPVTRCDHERLEVRLPRRPDHHRLILHGSRRHTHQEAICPGNVSPGRPKVSSTGCIVARPGSPRAPATSTATRRCDTRHDACRAACRGLAWPQRLGPTAASTRTARTARSGARLRRPYIVQRSSARTAGARSGVNQCSFTPERPIRAVAISRRGHRSGGNAGFARTLSATRHRWSPRLPAIY